MLVRQKPVDDRVVRGKNWSGQTLAIQIPVGQMLVRTLAGWGTRILLRKLSGQMLVGANAGQDKRQKGQMPVGNLGEGHSFGDFCY